MGLALGLLSGPIRQHPVFLLKNVLDASLNIHMIKTDRKRRTGRCLYGRFSDVHSEKCFFVLGQSEDIRDRVRRGEEWNGATERTHHSQSRTGT